MMLLRRLRQWRILDRRERGQAMVEFAAVSIIFFIVVFGILDMARLFQSWVTVQHAAREAARFAVTGQVACDGYTDDREACIVARALRATSGLAGGGLDGDAVTVTMRSWDYPSFSVETANSAGAQCDAVEVTVSYKHQMMAPLIEAILPDGVSISGKQRMLNEPFGPCPGNDWVPLPTATAPAGPTSTPPSLPTNTPTVAPSPTATTTPVPTATRTPVPTATRTPVPTATPGGDVPWWCYLLPMLCP